MTLNKKCFINVLKKEYPECLTWVIGIVSIIVGIIIGKIYSDIILLICNNILSIIIDISMILGNFVNLSSANIINFMVFITFSYFVIFGVAGMSHAAAKCQNSIENVKEIEAIVLISYGLLFICYIMCYAMIVNLSSSEAGACFGACLYEMCIGVIIFTTLNLLLTPIAYAYARCKGDPDEDIQSGKNDIVKAG